MGIPNRGLESLNLGLIMNLGHQGFNSITSNRCFESPLLRVSWNAEAYHEFMRSIFKLRTENCYLIEFPRGLHSEEQGNNS